MQLPAPQTFNAFDWLLVIVLVWSTVAALLRGIIRVLFSFAGLIAGILLAGWFYGNLALWMHPWITSRTADDMIAFGLIVVASMVVFHLAGVIARRGARMVGLGLPDRLLGGLFGFARGCLLGVAVMMAVSAFVPGTTLVAKSRLTPYFLDGAHAVSFVVPHDLQEKILRGAEELKHNAPHWIKQP
jgi:membrane protein required for colicin V production